MHIKKLNQEINDFLRDLDELYKEDAGEIIDNFDSYEDALEIIKNKYDKQESLCYCPNALTFKYKDTEYQLAVVLGVSQKQTNGMGPHGLSHILDKHSYQYEYEPTQEQLIKAAKNVKSALISAIKKRRIAHNPNGNKLIFANGDYIYIICLAKDDKELTYLHTLFMTKDKDYFRKYKRKFLRNKHNI